MTSTITGVQKASFYGKCRFYSLSSQQFIQKIEINCRKYEIYLSLFYVYLHQGKYSQIPPRKKLPFSFIPAGTWKGTVSHRGTCDGRVIVICFWSLGGTLKLGGTWREDSVPFRGTWRLGLVWLWLENLVVVFFSNEIYRRFPWVPLERHEPHLPRTPSQ